MIKPKIHLLFLIFVALISCNNNETEKIIKAQNIIPGNEFSRDNIEKKSDNENMNDSHFFSAQIVIEKNYSIFEMDNVNIDLDHFDEQIIITAPKNGNTGNFQIYIADYNQLTETYEEVFKSDLNGSQFNVVSIQTEDLNGDHLKEIIVRAIDNKENQLFQIFKLFSSKENEIENITVKNIFSKIVDGDLIVDKIDRPNDYKLEKTKGISFLIEIHRKNPENEKSLIIDKYKWNEPELAYTLKSTEKIKNIAISNESLKALYRGSSNDFLEFLSGPWYKTKDLEGNFTYNMDEILQMRVQENTMTFFSDDVQESFTWAEDKKPVKYRTVLNFYDVRNNFLKSMYFSIYINITSIDTIKIKIVGNKRWGGTYTKLTESLQNVLTDNSKENSLISDLDIKGLFKSNFNKEIIFDNPGYILKEDGREKKGIYALFELNGNHILQMKEINSNGLAVETNVYKMNYEETSDDLRIIRTVTLHKGRLEAKGIVLESNEELHFEQIEKLIQETSDN